jgi:hypothetical protein
LKDGFDQFSWTKWIHSEKKARQQFTLKDLYELQELDLFMAGVAEWFRRWAADPLYMGSIPIPGSNTGFLCYGYVQGLL